MDVYLERRVGIKPKIQSVASYMHQPPHIRRRDKRKTQRHSFGD